jgi:hypothetical protein
MGPSYRPGLEFVKRGVSSVPVTRSPAAAVVLLASLATRLPAQGLPPYAPVNPVADSRTGLAFEPLRTPAPGRWTAELALDYASTIERWETAEAGYLLDSETMRLRLRLARDLSPRLFAQVDAAVGGAYPGFMDGFLDWYHGLFGIRIPERERRPKNAFEYHIRLPDGRVVDRQRQDLFLGDLRVGLGLRHGRHLQTIASLTLPTSTAGEGYGRGTVAAAVVTSARYTVGPPLVYEGSLGVGYTPPHGDLSPFQRTGFLSASSGLRFRVWGRQSIYANAFYHSPYYEATRIQSLDRRELSLDFGWLLATRSGTEWRLGLTEDLEPGGPGVDLVFRLGVARY